MEKVVGNMTTIHCTTHDQIADVIATEGLTFSPHEVCLNTKKFIENDGFFVVSTDVDKNTWTESESCEGISYNDWKKGKLRYTEGISKGGNKMKKVKIVKYSKDYCWYKDRINCVFTVVEDEISSNCYRTINAHNLILKADCIEIVDEKSLQLSNINETNAYINKELLKPIFTKETPQMKNNLQVSLKIQPDCKTVVAECTHIAYELRGKGTLAEKNGYKIRSDYSTALSEDIFYVRGEDEERDYIIFSYNFDTPEQAQHYVKVMNELIDEINNPKIDWNKVTVGTKLTIRREFKSDNPMVKYIATINNNCTFKEYIPQTNQIIVFNDNKVEVYDASEVELC